MKAILVDDEKHNIENLEILISKHCPDVVVTGSSQTIAEAIILIETQKPHVVFLDIQMGASTGFDLLKNITDRNFEVIFVTAYDKYGIQAVKFAALDYILKPIDTTELLSAIDKVKEKLAVKQSNRQLDFLVDYLRQTGKPAKIALPQQGEVRYVPVVDIVRCEAQNTYTWFFLANSDKILVSKPLKEYDELLAPHNFIRCHQTHLVNPAFVKSFLKEDGGGLLLQNGVKIPVSKQKKDSVKEALNRL
ncbi:MAG: response regulator transcription factor [Flavisolibacter sp.]|nr:response regulator transcription factor [Flavisolibacter sp.]